MESREINFLTAFFFAFAGSLFFLWSLLPTKLDLPSAALLVLIASALGGLFWNPVLNMLKAQGLEPDGTSPFGGSAEARLFGGAAFGCVYFLPLAALLGLADVKIHSVGRSQAVALAGSLLVGATAGSSIFYGLGIRRTTDALGWSHLKQESALVLLWSGLIVGCASCTYAVVGGKWQGLPVWGPLWKAGMATGLAMLICYLTVFLFIRAVTSPGRHYEDVRGVFAAVAITFAMTFAHELCASRP
jgi:hypothetical protein